MSPDHADPDHVGALHHVELYASDLERSADFWGWLLGELGYNPKSARDDGRSWVRGPTYGVLAAAPEEESFDRRTPGLNHLAFHTASRQRVGSITEGVRGRAGSTVLYDDQHPLVGGYYALYRVDPEGIKVDVVDPEA